MKNILDEKYIVRLKDNDQEAFEKVFAHYKNQVYLYALSITKSEADAEDITQNVFIKVLKEIKQLKDVKAFRFWINRIAYRESLDYMKRHKKMTYLPEETLISNFKEDKKSNMELYNKEIVEIVKNEIDGLSNKYMPIAILYYLEEFSVREISEISSIPISTIRDRIKVISKKVSTTLKDKGYTSNHYYSIAGVPIILFVLEEIAKENILSKEASAEVWEGVQNELQFTNPSKVHNIVKGMSVKSIVTLVSVGTIISAVLIGAYMMQNTSTHKTNPFSMSSLSTMISKYMSREDHYINEIRYDETFVRYEVEVEVILVKEVNEEDIEIIINNEIQDFELKDHQIIFYARENGEYEIKVKKDISRFEITNIDRELPMLMFVESFDHYSILHIDDEYNNLDYDNSYVDYNNQKFYFSENHKLEEKLTGEYVVVLQDKTGKKVIYEINK